MRFVKEEMTSRRIGVDFPFIGLESLPKNQCGVYKIWFGKKYYIGKSTDIKKRVQWHRRHVIRALQELNFGSLGAHKNMLYHIWLTPSVKFARVEVLRRCHPIKVDNAEKRFIWAARNDNNCLNVFLIWKYQ